MEERDPNAVSVAERLISSLMHRFRDIQFTLHPEGLVGEAPGKNSNIAWAAKHAHKKYYGSENWKDVLLTVMDSTLENAKMGVRTLTLVQAILTFLALTLKWSNQGISKIGARVT